MQAEIIVPALGAELLQLSVWYADSGEFVFEGDRLVELLTTGATFDVAAPITGRLVEKRALPRDRLRPGQVLGIVRSEAGDE